MVYFIKISGINLKMTNKEVVSLSLDISNKKMGLKKIVLWLEENTNKR